MYYELHITLTRLKDYGTLKAFIEKMEGGWHYSCIAGDPVLGDTRFAYATTHIKGSVDLERVKDSLIRASSLLTKDGWQVVREKIELVVYDTKGQT